MSGRLDISSGKIWEKEEVPAQWKEGIVIKLPKKGNLRDCSNYQGIMLLSVLSKVFNRVLLERLKEAVEWNSPLYINFIDYEKAFISVDRDGGCSQQLKIVLLGGRNSGKNSLGNLILGKEEFVTKERTSCSRRVGMVAGRWLTVVDTPGWWCDFSVLDTPELVKREIVTSVSLCSPGPHIFLITVKATSPFSERRRRAVEEHVALLGEKAWGHCMVIFTSADSSQRRTAGECVETGGETLRWLSEKCTQRCTSVNLSDSREVPELLVKIQKVITKNGNRVFEMEANILQAAAKEKRRIEEKAQWRFIRMKQHRSLMREQLRPVTNIRIVLLGAKGSGKTSALHTILGKRSSHHPSKTTRCQVGTGVVFGRQLTVVDTPGWWMNYFRDETPVFDQREMVLSLSLCPPGPHVFLLVIRVDRAFTDTYRKAVQEHLELISESIWSRVILLFSFGDWLGDMMTEHYIESEGKPLQWVVERCRNRYHVLNGKTKGDGFQVRELIGKIEEIMSSCSTGWHYELERRVLEQLVGMVRTEKERARERLMKKQKQKQMARSQLEQVSPLSQLRLVLIGGRKTGKSSCGNTILNGQLFDTDSQTTVCIEKQGQISGRLVTVLDTPGGFSVASDFLTASCAILIVVNVSCCFKETHRKALEEQLEASGRGSQLWSRAMVLFSHGDCLGDTSVEQRIESERKPLQTLVARCGNRYHVVDNKQRGDGAQVNELIELVEEMLVGARIATLQSSKNMCESVSAAGEQPEATLFQRDLKELMSCQHDLSHDLLVSSTSTPLHSAEDPDAAQIVALPAARARGRSGLTVVDRDGLVSYIFSLLASEQGPRWPLVNLPVLVPGAHLRLNGERQILPFVPRHQTVLLVSSQTHHGTFSEGDFSVNSLCHPALKERTLRRLMESGDLQVLIDQWDNSSLEELEAFIDLYFEMVWEKTMGSVQPNEKGDTVTREKEEEEEVLLSIDRKLSKLDLLEEIRSELAELRQGMEHNWKAIEELRDKNKQAPDNTGSFTLRGSHGLQPAAFMLLHGDSRGSEGESGREHAPTTTLPCGN
ncbi:GTPase IMAP family member 8 [Pholidichthys leucotaenia]